MVQGERRPALRLHRCAAGSERHAPPLQWGMRCAITQACAAAVEGHALPLRWGARRAFTWRRPQQA